MHLPIYVRNPRAYHLPAWLDGLLVLLSGLAYDPSGLEQPPATSVEKGIRFSTSAQDTGQRSLRHLHGHHNSGTIDKRQHSQLRLLVS